MDIQIKQNEENVSIIIDGRIDTITAKDFEVKVKEVLALDAKKIAVDCEKLAYISSSGLRTFLILQKGANAKGASVVLQHLAEPIKEVFKITGFASIFNIED